MTKTASNPAGLLREVFTSGTDDPQNIEPTLLTLLDQGLLDQAMGELADEADVGDPHATWLWRFIYQSCCLYTDEQPDGDGHVLRRETRLVFIPLRLPEAEATLLDDPATAERLQRLLTRSGPWAEDSRVTVAPGAIRLGFCRNFLPSPLYSLARASQRIAIAPEGGRDLALRSMRRAIKELQPQDDEISATSGGVYVRFVVAALTTEQKLTRAQAKRLPRGAVMDQVIKQAATSRTKSQASDLDDAEGITEAFARDFPHLILAAPTLNLAEAVAVLLRMEIDGAIERILEKAGIEPAVARYAIVFTTETEGGIESAVVKGSHVVGVFRTSDEDMDVFEADFQQELAKTAWVKYDLPPFTDLAEISPEDLMALVTDDKDTQSLSERLVYGMKDLNAPRRTARLMNVVNSALSEGLLDAAFADAAEIFDGEQAEWLRDFLWDRLPLSTIETPLDDGRVERLTSSLLFVPLCGPEKELNCLARNSYKKLEALITRARFIPKGYSFKILAADIDGHFPRRPHFQALSKLAQLASHMAADPEHAFSRIYEEFSAAFDALDGRGLDFQRNLPETRLAVGLVARVDIANDDSRANSWAATTPEETLTQGLHGSLRDPRRKVTDAWRRGLKELTAKTPGLIIGQPTIDLAAATHALFTARFQWAIASDDNSPGQALKRDSIKTIHWYLGRDALKVMVATTYSGLIGPLIFPRSELSCLNGAVDAYFESLTSRAVSHSTEEDLLRESGAARR